MRSQFQTFAPPAGNVVNTTGQAAEETVEILKAALAEGRFKLG
jgi:hypothetical protein